jgi:hypothetical protein
MRRSIMQRPVAHVCLVVAGACGGAADSERHTVFDPRGATASAPNSPVEPAAAIEVERPFPQLDLPKGIGEGGWVGVSILRDGVRLSRPANWMIRDAGGEPGDAYVQYVSPKAYSFALYERSDSPGDPWRDIERRYEGDVALVGGKVLGRAVPMATYANQGRAYTIEPKSEASDAGPAQALPLPAFSRSRELLLRSEHRVVLAQIVSQDEDLSRLSEELLEILRHLEVR